MQYPFYIRFANFLKVFMSSEGEKQQVQKNESSLTDGGYNRIGLPSPVTSMTILHPNEVIQDIVGIFIPL